MDSNKKQMDKKQVTFENLNVVFKKISIRMEIVRYNNVEKK